MAATTTKAVRIGVIGAGRIGRMHAELLARQVPGARLTAVQDADEDTARNVAAPLGAVFAPTVDDVFEDADAVAICTPTPSHAQLMVEAARAGKAIFCEKPVSLELAEVDRALAAVQEAGVPFQIGFNRRFDPGHAAVGARVCGLDELLGDPAVDAVAICSSTETHADLIVAAAQAGKAIF